MIRKYIALGLNMRAIHTDAGMNAAAQIFARRLARKHYGRTGKVRTCAPRAGEDWVTASYRAFVGRKHDNEFVGHNVFFTIYQQS